VGGGRGSGDKGAQSEGRRKGGGRREEGQDAQQGGGVGERMGGGEGVPIDVRFERREFNMERDPRWTLCSAGGRTSFSKRRNIEGLRLGGTRKYKQGQISQGVV